MIDADFALMHKTRPAHDVASVTEITGRVRGKTALVGDDVIMTGGTLLANVDALHQKGATDVYVFATHGLFCDGALDKTELAAMQKRAGQQRRKPATAEAPAAKPATSSPAAPSTRATRRSTPLRGSGPMRSVGLVC